MMRRHCSAPVLPGSASAQSGTLDMTTFLQIRDRLHFVNDRDRGIFG
jgi:hypothetical protein